MKECDNIKVYRLIPYGYLCKEARTQYIYKEDRKIEEVEVRHHVGKNAKSIVLSAKTSMFEFCQKFIPHVPNI